MTTPRANWSAKEWAPFLESKADGSVSELSDLVLQYGDFLAPHTLPVAGHYNVTLPHPKGTLELAVGWDYVGLGADWRTYLRIALRPDAAQRVATVMGFVLPTSGLVDRLLSVGTRMPFRTGNPKYLRSVWETNEATNQDIAQLATVGDQPRLFVGHSKDVVLTNQLKDNLTQVAIYGGHGRSCPIEKPVQELTTVHVWNYVDYSQRVRFVHNTCRLAGVETPTLDAIATFNNPIPLVIRAYPIRSTTGAFVRKQP